MSERLFSSSPEAQRLSEAFAADFATTKARLEDPAISAEDRKKAFENLQSIATSAAHNGQYGIIKDIIRYIPADAAETLTTPDGKVSVLQRYKKDLIRNLLTNYGDGGFANKVFDLAVEKSSRLEKEPLRATAIHTEYAKKAAEYRASEHFQFFYSFLLSEMVTDVTLRDQLTESGIWGTFLSKTITSAAVVGVEDQGLDTLMALCDRLPNQRIISVFKTQGASEAALALAGVSKKEGAPQKSPQTLSGSVSLRRAVSLLEKVSVKNNEGIEQVTPVADAYYGIIIAYSTELLEHGFTYEEIETIAKSIEPTISKYSGKGILRGHLEAIREVAQSNVKKAA